MRIGIVTGEYPPMQGGVGAYTRILAKELSRQGEQVFVFSTQEAKSQDAEIHLNNSVPNWGLSTLYRLRRWAQAERLDVVSLQFQTAAFAMSPWIHFLPDVLRPVPVVTTFHDLRYPYLFPKAGRLRDWIVMRLARASRGVIVTNHEDFERLKQLSHSTLIPIGSNILKALPQEFNPQLWRDEVGAEKDEFLLAYFGLINRSKGLETLLPAIRQLRDHGIAARLVMIGGGAGASDPTNTGYMQEIDSLIDQLGLQPCVHKTGYIDDEQVVGAYLAASDAVVLPFVDGASYRRGSLMAAVRYGCAIVTTLPAVKVPTFQSGENMLLVVPNDVAGLVEALLRLRESEVLRKKLRCGASDLARSFEWPQITRETAAFFRYLIEESA